MHAFLLIGQTNNNFAGEIADLSKKLSAKVMEFPIIKIDDVRSLNDLIRLSFNEPTLILSKNINLGGEEALNAFLKNLEEPQENVYFALTAPSEKSVLSTIVSRCQIIKVQSTEYIVQSEQETLVKNFLNSGTEDKFKIIDKIKDRQGAIEFIQNIILFLHKEKNLNKIELFTKTLNNLKANGNVLLHLTNLVVALNE